MIKTIYKVAGIIIQNNKLLLVTGNKNFYWTPGGKIDQGETPEDTLLRELEEELQISNFGYKKYFEYLSEQEEDGIPRKVYCYIVDYPDPILTPYSEITSLRWFHKDELEMNHKIIQLGVRNHLLPRLYQDGFLT